MTALIDFLKDGERTIYPVSLTEGIYDKGTGEALDSILKRMSNNLSGAQSGLLYTTTAPSTVAVGGLPLGWSCNSNSVTDVFDKMLHPYVAPKIKTSVTPNDMGYHEFGTVVDVQDFMITVTRGSADISKIEVIREGQLVGVLDSGIMDGGTFIISIDIEHPAEDTTYQIKVTDETGAVTNSSVSYDFVYPIYYGATEIVSDTNVLLLHKMIEDNTHSKVFSINTQNNKFVFAYPAIYGELKSVIDSNSFNVLEAFDCVEITLSCIDGSTQQYKVYSTYTASVMDNYTLEFQFQEV